MGRHPTGIDRVCLAYLEHFGSDAQCVVQHRRIRRILDRDASAALVSVLAAGKPGFRASLVRKAMRFGLRRGCAGRGRIYLNVGHTGLNDPGFKTWLGQNAVRPVYFVHDLIPITHPEFCRAGEREKHLDRMRTVLETATGLIANSEATVRELETFAGEERLSPPRSIAALLGADMIEAEGTVPPADRPVEFVVLGTIEARKNHLMLLEIWRRLNKELGEKAPRLLIIGQRGWECEEVFKILDRAELFRGAVVEVGKCEDQELAQHLSRAKALLFPSLVEGYGLPLVEALRAGTPVIASDLPVFREIAGEIPQYLDPRDSAAWEQVIRAYCDSEGIERKSQLRRMAGYRAPTWADHFATVDPWIASL